MRLLLAIFVTPGRILSPPVLRVLCYSNPWFLDILLYYHRILLVVNSGVRNVVRTSQYRFEIRAVGRISAAIFVGEYFLFYVVLDYDVWYKSALYLPLVGYEIWFDFINGFLNYRRFSKRPLARWAVA